MSNTKTIVKNTGWYGLESAISSLVGLATSIAIARTLGPSRMGYIIYVSWIASVVSSLGSMGIPATTQKYMAEYIGRGDRGTARYIYFRTLRLQILMATLATCGILVWVLHDAGSGYRLASSLIALSIWPSMVNFVSAQANVATEELSTNLPASILSIFVFFGGVLLTLIFHWGVVGVGASMFTMRAFDLLWRLFPTMRRILAWESEHVEPEGLRARMLSFSWQSVASMVVALIVWDRSEFFLLKNLCSDIRQVSYYSVAFSMADRLMIGSAVFGAATGATIFAQYGRDRSQLAAMTAATFRYLALSAIPLHFISAALAYPALLLLYGNKYVGAGAVVALAPLLCMPKAFSAPIQSMLQSMERQSLVIGSTVVAGVMDIGVAWWLIPKHGAVGACIGSGAAQFTAVGILWAVAVLQFGVRLPWGQISKIVLVSTAAALTAHLIAMRLSPLPAIVLGGSASLAVLFGLLYVFRVFEPQDYPRLRVLTGFLPKSVAGSVDRFLVLLIRPGYAS